MKFAGHCWRSKEELASDVLLWTPLHGKSRVGRPAITYVDQLMRDTGCTIDELPTAMQDRDGWKKRVMAIRENSIR